MKALLEQNDGPVRQIFAKAGVDISFALKATDDFISTQAKETDDTSGSSIFKNRPFIQQPKVTDNGLMIVGSSYRTILLFPDRNRREFKEDYVSVEHLLLAFYSDERAPQIKPIVVMNKSESIGSLDEVASEALPLGFGEPIAISAETGLGMTTLYENQRWCSRLSTGRLNPWLCKVQRARGFTTKAGKDHERRGGDERWTDILARAFSVRLEKYLKNKCKKNSNFAARVLKAMQNVQRFKGAIMYGCTGEEEPHKDYDADSAAKALARLLGPATIAVLVFLVKQMFGAVQDMFKQRRMKNDFDNEMLKRQEKILQSAKENVTERAKEITEEIEKMKKSHKEEIEALTWLTLHLSRRK